MISGKIIANQKPTLIVNCATFVKKATKIDKIARVMITTAYKSTA